MRTFLLRGLAILMLLLISVFAALAAGANQQMSVGSPLKSPAAIGAKLKYDQANSVASQQYLRELDGALKLAMQSGLLDEANALSTARAKVVSGEWFAPHFTTPTAQIAFNRYKAAFITNKQQYLRTLDVSLKSAMARSDLTEANALSEAKKQIEAELQILDEPGKRNPTIMDKSEAGLLLTVGNETKPWKNKKVSLPSAKTYVSISGLLIIPVNTRLLKLRSGTAYGSERLRFTIDGKTMEFQAENNHRFVTYSLPAGTQQVRLEIGRSIAATEWEWGPLEWSINGGKWREISAINLKTK